MLVKEYRIPLPMAVEEYRVAQLYMIQVGGGAGAGRPGTRPALDTCACDARFPARRIPAGVWCALPSTARGAAPRRGCLRHCMGSPARSSRCGMLIACLAGPDGALVSSRLWPP